MSSTLYMAAQYAGLEIVKRNPHYAGLPYIRPGFDATVWFEDPARGIKWATHKKGTRDGEVLFDGLLHKDVYGYNPPVPKGMPHYETNKPRVGGWPDPTNTTGWAEAE